MPVRFSNLWTAYRIHRNKTIVDTIFKNIDRAKIAIVNDTATSSSAAKNFVLSLDGGFSNGSGPLFWEGTLGGGWISYFVSAEAWFWSIFIPLHTLFGWFGSSLDVLGGTGSLSSIINVCDGILLSTTIVFSGSLIFTSLSSYFCTHRCTIMIRRRWRSYIGRKTRPHIIIRSLMVKNIGILGCIRSSNRPAILCCGKRAWCPRARRLGRSIQTAVG